VERPALKADPASVADVEDALARLRMVGRRYDDARKNAERAIAAAPEDPRGYELQGELAQESGDLATAHVAYRTAIAKGSRDFRPYFEIAAADHARAAEADGAPRNITPETARAISNRYERAINLNPRHRPAYQGLAQLVEWVPPGNVEDGRFLEQGLKLFPDDGMVRLGLAMIAKREGNTERARALLAEVAGAATTQPGNVIAYARRLESEWMQHDVFAQVDALVNERKYAEALALVDGQIAAGADFGTRQRLQATRNSLQASQLLEEARVAISKGRWDDAREKFKAVLESNAPPLIKSQVRRQLEQMDKRGIGKRN
jgi:tetratricopeptide (TPR) repeat protein